MTSHDAEHAGARSLRGLRALAPDPDRAERFRNHCRTQLARRQPEPRTAGIDTFARRVLVPTVGAAFCALYFAMLVVMTLRFEGVL